MSDSNHGLFNQTNTTNFILEIPDGGLTQAFKFNLQAASVPGVHIPATDVPGTPQGMYRSKIPGSTFEFDAVPIRILVDENLDSWVEAYKWMLACQNYLNRDKSGWKNDGEGFPGAVLMHVLDNDKKEIVMTLRYIGGWCSDLSEIEYNLSEDADPAMVFIATLQFKYIEVEHKGKVIDGRSSVNDTRESNYQKNVAMHPSLR